MAPNRVLTFPDALRHGSRRIGNFEFKWNVRRVLAPEVSKTRRRELPQPPYRLHFGPGPGWTPDAPDWLTVDVDPERGDIVVDFARFQGLYLPDESVTAIY